MTTLPATLLSITTRLLPWLPYTTQEYLLSNHQVALAMTCLTCICNINSALNFPIHFLLWELFRSKVRKAFPCLRESSVESDLASMKPASCLTSSGNLESNIMESPLESNLGAEGAGEQEQEEAGGVPGC